MSDKLKKFVTDHKQEFDSGEPSRELWKNIDTGMKNKNSSWIKSKLLRYVYFGFGLSAIVLAVYFISSSSGKESTGVSALAENTSVTNQINKTEVGSNENSLQTTVESIKTSTKDQKIRSAMSADANKDSTRLSSDLAENYNVTNENTVSEIEKAEDKNSLNEKKEASATKKNKKASLYIPEDPEKINTYTGTLYEGPTFCSLLGAYKLTGQANVDNGGRQDGHLDKVTVRSVGCGYLAKIPTMKAIWIKGRTSAELKLSIKKEFKNIVLVKSDGRKFNPRAISHYYTGLGAIGEYKGKYFDLTFTDKVELILFFKDAEEGDKIIIDGTFEVIVKDQPK